MSDFDFLIESEDAPKRRMKQQCRNCRYYNKIPDHQLTTASSDWENKGICWYRKEVLKKDPVVNMYWRPKYDCKFDWKDMLKKG